MNILPMASPEIMEMIKSYIDKQIPIFITSQNSMTGKTTLINKLASYIPSNEKIMAIPEKSIEEFTFRFDYAAWIDINEIKHIHINQNGVKEIGEFSFNNNDWIVIDGLLRYKKIGINNLFKHQKIIVAFQLPYSIEGVLEAFIKYFETLPDQMIVIQTEKTPYNQRINGQFSTRIQQITHLKHTEQNVLLERPSIEILYSITE